MSCQSTPGSDYYTDSPLSQWSHRYGICILAGPGSVGGPMRCPWYLFHRLF
ncbi:unnamed protein product [Staurois parvus]|uniref:Uncharacterized protein n=1 Tax=Staurois parvus TaxID=386267 RepID=A0ABN9FCQ4_9NEOB|nr:unnamed protein product [Staurois parvus]